MEQQDRGHTARAIVDLDGEADGVAEVAVPDAVGEGAVRVAGWWDQGFDELDHGGRKDVAQLGPAAMAVLYGVRETPSKEGNEVPMGDRRGGLGLRVDHQPPRVTEGAEPWGAGGQALGGEAGQGFEV